jgi:predicted CopG family antitoxin
MPLMKQKKEKGKVRTTISLSEKAFKHGQKLAEMTDRNFSNLIERLIKKEASAAPNLSRLRGQHAEAA